ncbi:response regulator [Pseudobowmanella zhangzhouensis]|uniref:response regulator n=1 Tax=Pseudobowmanella zhangzhouensis TaxID=1537679 RepID=UPI00366D96AA
MGQQCLSEGLNQLTHQHFDLCLLDYQLGAHTGIDVLRQINQSDSAPPVVMLTGQADSQVDEAALDAGATDYLLKAEVDSGRFIRSIRYALARRDMQREKLERLRAESENRAKDRFLAHLSHELRTPLTAMLGYTELLLSRAPAAQPQQELHAILRNGKHLLSLLNDVLDLSKIAADKLELNPSPMNLASMLSEVMALTHALALEKNLALNFDCPAPVPQMILVDATRFRQVLINLIGNGIKFTERGSVTLKIRYQPEHTSCPLQLSVQDTGIGIDSAHLDKIFQPFEQVEDAVRKSTQGTGLGLAICAELVQRMGGTLNVTSAIGQGSEFFVSLPIGDIPDNPLHVIDLTGERANWQRPAPLKLEGRVLVVDDMPDLRDMMQAQIRHFGVLADTAANGQQAVELAFAALDNGQPYDVILLDLHMPQMDGYQAIRALRQRVDDIPILALTAATLKGRAEQLHAMGFTDMLAKPMETNQLVSVLQHYLAPASARQSEGNWLLVEDDPDAAEATAAMLEMQGISVDVVHNAEDCKQRAKHHSYARIIVDLGLPDQDGLSLLEELRASDEQVDLVILSGRELSDELIAPLNISLVLQKPLFLEQIQQLSKF